MRYLSLFTNHVAYSSDTTFVLAVSNIYDYRIKSSVFCLITRANTKLSLTHRQTSSSLVPAKVRSLCCEPLRSCNRLIINRLTNADIGLRTLLRSLRGFSRVSSLRQLFRRWSYHVVPQSLILFHVGYSQYGTDVAIRNSDILLNARGWRHGGG
jgi:hypothetical protein